MEQELALLEQYIQEAQQRLHTRAQLREANFQDTIDYPSESSLNRLDSSIKKNSAFVKRLKIFTESQKEQILNEIDKLNLSKFISEVAASIIEAKLKLSDVSAVIEICTKLNQIYRDFSKQLLEQYVKYFPAVKRKNQDSSFSSGQTSLPPYQYAAPSSNSSSPNTSPSVRGHNKSEVYSQNPSKTRVDLRLFAELLVSGVFPFKEGFPVLMSTLCYLMINDKNNHLNANAVLTFCKGCGDEILGLVPRKIKGLAEKYTKKLPKSDLVPKKRQDAARGYIRDYYLYLIEHFNSMYDELGQLISKNKRLYKSKGEIPKEAKELVDVKHSECQKTQNLLSQFAELLCEEEPDYPDYAILKETVQENVGDVDNTANLQQANKSSSIWDDEGSRSFYEDLVDLKNMFPNLVVKASAESKKLDSLIKAKNSDVIEQLGAAESIVVQDESRDNSPSINVEDSVIEEIDKVSSSSSSEENMSVNEATLPQVNNLVMSQLVANRIQPDQYFSKLSNCVNRDMIDSAAVDFIRFFNTKFGRRKLVKTLFNVQRTRLDLLPFFARLAATLYPYVPSVGNELVSLLKQDFRNLFRKKDQINIESKVKNVRFIGELVKFNLYSRQEAFSCLKLLLSDFTHHHIEMTCNLLETCGRLLYKTSDSHHQLRLLLEQMMRKKLLLSIDSKYVTMIENAYYFTNPPEVTRQIVEEPQVYIYVRYLLCECLNRSTIEVVLKKIKKLNWNDKALTKFVINCMTEAYNVKFYNIRYLAALLAALNKDHQWIAIAVIDGVVEDILLMMEINELHFNQRRIPMIRYFGELYNYRLSDSSLVFKILYSLITYGVNYPAPEQAPSHIPLSNLDLPDNLFRIKLVCDLLETCGQYLSSGQEKRKLDCYLLFFQRYYWCKRHIYLLHPYCLAKSGNQFPPSIEYLYNDAVYNLRPAFEMATSYSQATDLVQNFIDGLVANQQSSSTS